MLRSEELKKLILTHQRRLLKLKEQQAVFGASVDPSVLIQIEDIETELARLREELAALPPDEEETDEIITSPVPATRAPKPLNLAEAKPHQGELPLPAALPQPPRAPWPVKQWPWLAGGLMVIGVAVGLLGNQMGGQFFVAPTAMPTATATATLQPAPTITLTLEPFNLDTYPKGAVTQSVEVRLWAAPGCDQPILVLNEQIKNSLVELIDSDEIILDDVHPEPYLPDTPLDNPNAAGLDIWTDCDATNPTKINFKLGETTGPPPEVYSPSKVNITQGSVDSLDRNIALGLIYYQRRDYSNASSRLASAALETNNTILGLLYGNSLIFQYPPQPDNTNQFYDKAINAYKNAIPANDSPPELAAQVYNNLGVAFFAQGLWLGEFNPDIQATFDRAIALQKDQPWPYFNRAYARLYTTGTSQTVTEDCQQAIKIAQTQNNTLAETAGYTCLIELLLSRLDEESKNEIEQLLNKIKTVDYPPPYALRGKFYALGRPDITYNDYTCYLLEIRDRVKLPIEIGRIGVAQDYLKSAPHQSLGLACPISSNGF